MKLVYHTCVHHKNTIFTHEREEVTAYIVLEKSHHVVKFFKNIELGPPHLSLCLCIPQIAWNFWSHYTLLY